MSDPATILLMGKEVSQVRKASIAKSKFVDSTMKATTNMKNTMMEVEIMNWPCTSLGEMLEVTSKIIGRAATETIPFPPVLIYCKVLDHLALRSVLQYFNGEHRRCTERLIQKRLSQKKRDESTTDEKTQDPKFAKELAALFKRTEPIKHNRADSMVFPIAVKRLTHNQTGCHQR